MSNSRGSGAMVGHQLYQTAEFENKELLFLQTPYRESTELHFKMLDKVAEHLDAGKKDMAPFVLEE